MKLVILGAGGYGRMVGDIAEQSGKYSEILFLDDNPAARNTSGTLPDFVRFAADDTEFYPAFGNNEGRLDWIRKISGTGRRIASLIHATAYVSPKAEIGCGVMILPHATVNTGCRLETGCLINSGAVVDHDCVLEEGVHICIGALVKAENRISRCLKVEAGQVIVNRQYPL